jgi:hypothetical protein
MHKAKMEAIKRNTDVKVVFDVNGERYAISLEGDSDGNWDDIDANRNLEVVRLNKYKGSVTYGHGEAQHPRTGAGESFPDDNVSYSSPDNIASFNEQGTGSSGYVYFMNNHGSTFAIGSHYGVVVIYGWKDGKWKE